MRNARSDPALLLLAAAAAFAGGCESGPSRPALISHPVFVTLNDPADAPALIADADRLLSTIPAVASYACGTPLETGRANITTGYHVGMYIGFDSEADYMMYVEHPQHVRFVEAWRPKIRELRIYDVIDAQP